ncbi:ATP-binding protein [Flavobacterium muglaense]|uniref:ATP-binding protein n=1 Tax=Flavobacterium muglaense TaxID=2764716 RepID=A0A923N3L5_9FLAO|nr:tetratricopeptide repeat-containing sensor histidine kinase [Flavobacterium muglaense]MBC5838932.1 ATP-binding protein [Flavobacterium muglaense]MBC5845435.1 ATP-binding protein [Flavobacterium muglaense]
MPRTQKPLLLPTTLLLLLFTVAISCKKETKPTTIKKDLTAINKLLEKGHELFTKQEFDSSYYYYNKARNEAELVQDTSRIIHALAWMSELQTNKGDYTGSENTSVEALPYLGNKHKFLFGETNIYIGLGNNYLLTLDNDKAIYYFKKAINSKTDETTKAAMFSNISIACNEKKEFNKAIETLIPLLKIKETDITTQAYTNILSNLGHAYDKTNNPQALYYLNKAYQIRKKTKDNWGIIGSCDHLATYFQFKNKPLSKEYALEGYQISNEIKHIDPNTKLEFLKHLIHASTGIQTKKYSTLYITLNDSITKARLHAKNSFAKIKYDSKKEKEENIRLKEQKAANLLQLEIQKTKTEGLYLLILVLLIATAFIYYYLRVKNRREKIKASYITEIQIAKKLHDELANDVYQMMKFAETQDLSTADNKALLLQNIDTIYARTRNISKENGNIETGTHFKQQLKDMMADFNTSSTSILSSGIENIEWYTIEDTKKITLYRVIQELLVNMKKHSKSTVAVVSLQMEKDNLLLHYSDNGIGIKTKPVFKKNGLQNIENRIEQVKGTIVYDLTSQKGIKIRIQFPV